MKVERIHLSDEVERFAISAGNKSIVMECNRPLLKNTASKNKRIQWKPYQGTFTDPAALAMVLLKLEKYLEDNEDDFVWQK